MRALLLSAMLVGCGGPEREAREPGAPADAAPAAEAPAPAIGTPFGDGSVDARLVNEPGQLVPLAQVLAPGKVTVIDFWADWCGACKVMEQKLLAGLRGIDGVAVRKLDIVDDTSPISVEYGVGRSLPEMWIFDRNGAIAHRLSGSEVENAARLAIELARQ